MSNPSQVAIAMVVFLAALGFANESVAQAGAGCGSGTLAATECGLGGQLRGQVKDGLPLPISIAPGQYTSGYTPGLVGPFTAITIQTAPATPNALPLIGKGLGQPGQIKPTPSATIMQTTGPAPRALTLAPGAFRYGNQPQGSIGIVNFDFAVFAIQTNLSYDTPHPGTTKLGGAAVTFSGAAIPTAAANVLSAGGRAGATTVTYYANATDATTMASPGNNFGSPTMTPTVRFGEGGSHNINGIARYTATGNQFGGQAIGRAMGTARIYFNSAPLVPATDLPCKVTATPGQGTTAQGFFVPFNTGTDCFFGLSIVDISALDSTVGVAGAGFGVFKSVSTFMMSMGFFTGTIGFNGTIIGQNDPVTNGSGMNIPWTGEAKRTIGFPLTTGRLTISVTDSISSEQRFIRTGVDARDANGNGIVALVSGSLTVRDITRGTANPTWITLEIPEPGAIVAASAGLFALYGCHLWARRRANVIQHSPADAED